MPTDKGPITLLFFAHAMQSRGTERAVIRLLREFDRSKVRPELALVSFTGDFIADIPEDVTVHRLGREGMRTSRAIVPLLRLLRKRRPDVAVGVHTSSSRLLAICGLFVRGMPTICFEADPFSRVERSKGSYPLRRALTMLSHRFIASRVVAVSEFVATDIAHELRVPRSKMDVIPIPSVDEAVFDMASEELDDPSLFEGPPVVISLGHMFEHKDQQTLVRAFAQVRKERPARLVMIGDGPLLPELRRLADELGIANDAFFPGFQRNPFRFLIRASVFVSPSASEGFDVSQVEAMACRVPVVVTDAPRFQAVENETNGLTVAPGDPASMARAIQRILDEPDLAARLVESASVFATTLSAPSIARRWEELLGQLAG